MRKFFALLSALLLSSCGLENQVATVSCGEPPGTPQASLLLFGEMHGSREAPELIGRIACSSALRGPTAIGLELPTTEQNAIDAYLVSDGSESSKRKLLSGRFWQEGRDGRSSTAMTDLIEYVRTLNKQGVPLQIFAFDSPSGLTRDASLAQGIRDFHADNQNLSIIALMGNVHASQQPIQRNGEQIVTSGALLHDLSPISVLVAYRSGSIWACMSGCGVHEISSDWGGGRQPGFVDESPIPGYDVSYVLPTITASPPAVDGIR
jgi:hypothetical protein